jgi:hypothetical protein
MLTYEYVNELLKYDHETGILTWKVPRQGIRVGNEAGCLAKNGYRYVRIDGKNYLSHRLAWLLYTREWPADQIDHINQVRDDNRIKNLREVSHRDNLRNQKKPKNNSSGVVGVFWFKPTQKWRALIQIDGKLKHLGLFKALDDAVAVRKAAEKEYGYHPNHGRG